MKLRLNSNHLKLIAILAMTLDHVADLIWPGYAVHPVALAMHIVGRLTAPIMWFFVCEGFFYTRNVKRYAGRMLLFAVISHFAYCFAFNIEFIPLRSGIFNQTSVIWPLFWAVIALWVLKNVARFAKWQVWAMILAVNLITFPANWSCIAVMAITSMYAHRGNLKKQMLWMLFWVAVYAAVSFFCVNKVYAAMQLGVVLVYPLLRCYNGERGRAKWMKWLFYIYYPAHLVVIGLVRLAAYGDMKLLF